MSRVFSPAGLADTLPELPAGARWWVGYSGGLDSTVLLHAMVHLGHSGERLAALHVHHGLQPDADRWAAHCEATCRRLGVICRSVRVDARPGRRESPEAAARRARYAAFEAALGPDDILLLAHHADDQLETLLLRLLRGAGTRGLAGMPVSRALGAGRLHRPLLGWSRAALHGYASATGLAWIEDPSNAALAADRNHLRHAVVPMLRARWPDVSTRAARTAAQLAEDAGLLGELAQIDLGGSRIIDEEGVLALAALPLATLRALSPARCCNALREALRLRALEPPPSAARLQEFARQLGEAGDDRRVSLHWAGGELRCEGARLWLLSKLPVPPQTTVTLRPGRCHEDTCGHLWLAPATPAGQAGECLLLPGELEDGVEVVYRAGGERFGRGRGRRLSALLQSRGVPAWLRPRLPLVRTGGRVIGVAGRHPRLNPQPSGTGATWQVCWAPAAALLPGLEAPQSRVDL